MNKIVPVPEAMLICDSIITEVGTGKKSLIGIFDNITTLKFPFRHYKLSVYVKFTNAEGKYNFNLELIDLENNAKIGEGTVPELNITDRLNSHELAFNLTALEFHHPGKYDFRISFDSRIFANKTFNVIQITNTPKDVNN